MTSTPKPTLDLRGQPNHLLINAAIARHVLKREVDDDRFMRRDDERMGGETFESWQAIPDYATSAEAILPLLDECACDIRRVCGEEGFPETWEIDLETGAPNGNGKASDRSFALAACIALLRSHKVEVIT